MLHDILSKKPLRFTFQGCLLRTDTQLSNKGHRTSFTKPSMDWYQTTLQRGGKLRINREDSTPVYSFSVAAPKHYNLTKLEVYDKSKAVRFVEINGRRYEDGVLIFDNLRNIEGTRTRVSLFFYDSTLALENECYESYDGPCDCPAQRHDDEDHPLLYHCIGEPIICDKHPLKRYYTKYTFDVILPAVVGFFRYQKII